MNAALLDQVDNLDQTDARQKDPLGLGPKRWLLQSSGADRRPETKRRHGCRPLPPSFSLAAGKMNPRLATGFPEIFGAKLI
jgi:hypothetical protein